MCLVTLVFRYFPNYDAIQGRRVKEGLLGALNPFFECLATFLLEKLEDRINVLNENLRQYKNHGTLSQMFGLH